MLQLWFFANSVFCPFSISLGGMSVWLNVPVLLVGGAVWFKKKQTITLSSVKVFLLVIAYIFASFLVAAMGPCEDKFLKSIMTSSALILLVLVGVEVGRRATSSEWLSLQKTAIWSLIVAFAGFALEMAMPSIFPNQTIYRVEGKLSGLYQEPSEVAFTLFPCVVVLLVSGNRKIRRSGMLALLGLIIFSRSSTLFALIISWILYRLLIHRKLRQAGLAAVGFSALIAFGSAINYDLLIAPTIDRIAGVVVSSETAGISSLVYLQGWQDAWANFSRTRGLGLGFNMMGCHPLPDVPARQILALGGADELNSEDGSFQFSKVVSETGAAGIVLYIAIIWWWFQLEGKIPTMENDADRTAAATQAALMFCFVASSFIRSNSYFSGGILLWVVAASGASKGWRKLDNSLGVNPGSSSTTSEA